MSFALDERLARDTFVVGDLPLSRVLQMNDARWPWLILVPRRAGAVELTNLDAADRARLVEEATLAARFLKAHARADKINIGALGNVISQFHLHMVGDPAWPGPVWGHGVATPYDEANAPALIEAARKALEISGEVNAPPAAPSERPCMSEHRLGAAGIRFAFLIEPPFCYRASDGAVTGCDVEVARHCLHTIGVETIVFLETEFPELLPGLANGRWDMTTGLFVTDERRRLADFSRPIWALPDGLLVRSDNPHEIVGYGTFARARPLRLAVVRDQVQHRTALRLGVGQDQIHLFETSPRRPRPSRPDGRRVCQRGNGSSRIFEPQSVFAADRYRNSE